MNKIWNGFDAAPKNVKCCICLKEIPEGTQCYGKTLLIGSGTVINPLTTFVCKSCFEKSS
jgi:hypothetical protein